MGRQYGLERSRRHAQALWQLDVDYADRLPPAEREYLNRFLHEYYLSAPSSVDNLHTPDQMRENWRAHKSNKNDCHTQSEFTGRDEADERRAGFHEQDMASTLDHKRAVALAEKAWASAKPKTKRRKKTKAKNSAAAALGQLGGKARAKRMNKAARKASAEKAARARWFAARPAPWPMPAATHSP